MCVILQIEKGASIPSAKLERACDINPDGYGIAYLDKGGIKFLRSIKKNDPKEVADHLQRLRDREVFVHLRYATVGEVSIENTHPFVILRNKHAVQVAMMHNGTLSSYTPQDKSTSDTKLFVNQMVTPLALRSASFQGANRVLEDTIFQRVIETEAGLSVLVLFDKWGNVLKINEQKGKQFEGWWASNEYSFDDHHFRSSAKNYHYRSVETYRAGYWKDNHKKSVPWQEDKLDDPITKEMEEFHKDVGTKNLPTVITRSIPYTSVTDLREQVKAVAMAIQNSAESTLSIRNLTVTRTSFLEMSGLKSLENLGSLTQKDIQELNSKYPAAMAQMFTDLFSELRECKTARHNQAITIQNLTKDKA